MIERCIRQIHDLKTWPEFFNEVLALRKTFEIRKMDRDFVAGDILNLLEWDPTAGAYTGRRVAKVVRYLFVGGQFGVASGYCVMGLGHADDPLDGDLVGPPPAKDSAK